LPERRADFDDHGKEKVRRNTPDRVTMTELTELTELTAKDTKMRSQSGEAVK